MTDRVRVAHLVSHPIQNMVPLYRELTQRDNIALSVFFRSDRGVAARIDPGFGLPLTWDRPLLEGYKSRFLLNADKDTAGRPYSLSGLDFAIHLTHGRFDVLWIHGYNYLTNQLALVIARMFKIPVLLRDDAHLLGKRSRTRRIGKELLLRPLFRLISGGLYVGQANHNWYRHYDMSPSQLFRVPHSVDNDYFTTQRSILGPSREALRRSYGFSSRQTVFIFLGKFIHVKAPMDLLRAFATLVPSSSFGLLMVGDGPMRAEMTRFIEVNGLANVRLTGFLNQSEIAKAYSTADVHVLCSLSESWGLVVNEAMNFGLPAIVSNQVGCANDLVLPGETGSVVRAGDISQLAQAMLEMQRNPDARHQLGTNAFAHVQQYSVATAAEGIENACKTVVKVKRRRVTRDYGGQRRRGVQFA